MSHAPKISVSVLLCSMMIASPSAATPGQGFQPNPIVSGHFGEINMNTAGDKTGKWGLHLKTLDDTDIAADRLTVQPNGFSGWHRHPGPVFVTVTQGTVEWVDGSDPLCTAHTYNAGDSFIERAFGPHNVRNPSGTVPAEFVAVTIKPEGFVGPAFRIDVSPAPTNCNF